MRRILMRRILGTLAAGVVAAVATASATRMAEAGTPYTCNCYGKPKRFIGATKACEITQHVKKCTRKNYRSFVAQACAKNGCKARY